MSTTAAFSGGDDVTASWCPQVPPPPDETQPDTALSGYVRAWCPPISAWPEVRLSPGPYRY
jgi:hypothetical protein